MITRFIKSMGYAIKGIFIGLMEERNLRIDIIAALYVIFFSRFYNFTKAEMAVVLLLCFVVPAFEMVNTAIERAVKNPYPDRYMIAGEAKDTAAGAVLIAALGALVAGIFLFWNTEVFYNIFIYFKTSILRTVILIISILLSYFIITIDKNVKK